MKQTRWTNYIVHTILLVVVLLSVFPFYVMVINSFKTGAELSINSAGLPHQFTFKNYVNLFSYNGGLIVRTFLNSIFITTSYILLTVIISSLASFGFAKYRFYGREIIFAVFLATMMLPEELLLPPLYILFSKIGWLNSYYVQIFPGVASVFALFLLRQFMMSIPDALLEAARMDGAKHLQIYRSVIIPISAPMIGTLCILLFKHKWDEFLWPIIMVSKPKLLPIMVIIPTLSENGDVQSIPWELVMAGCTLVTIPLLILFIIFQDKIMSSVAAGAVKG
jgi:ABC-type glycerol-3-phosphate transport system permease component